MKTDLNLLAVMADAEARSTATLVELMAAASLAKLTPPEGDAVVTLEISQGDLSEIAQQFYWEAEYDDAGTMKLHLTRNIDSLESGQSAPAPEVTSAS